MILKVSKRLIGAFVLGIALLTSTLFSQGVGVSAATERYLGVDWSVYQGANGIVGPNDKFAIVQIGGTYGGKLSTQSTYSSQVASAKKQGLRAHTYIWYQVGSSQSIAKSALDYFLPKVQTPKGSIVALDYESGASSSKTANTSAILYGMNRIKAAGYTPMLYSGQAYLNAHVNASSVIAKYPDSLWVARYPDYAVRNTPNYNYFPSMDGVGIWQYTSTQIAGGLDGNVDLVGITLNGYKSTSTATPTVTPAKPVATTGAGAKLGTAHINYPSSYGIQIWTKAGKKVVYNATDAKAAGKKVGDAKKLPGQSNWKVFNSTYKANGTTYYCLGGDQYIDAAYVTFTPAK